MVQFLQFFLFFVVSPGSVRSSASTILYRPLLSLGNSWSDSDGRFLLAEFSFRDSVFRICSVYAPNRNPARDQFFDDLIPKIDPSVPTILAGDLNAVFDRLLDWVGSSPDDPGCGMWPLLSPYPPRF